MAAIGVGAAGLQTAISITGLGTISNGVTGVSAAFTVPYVTNATAALATTGNIQFSAASFTPSATPAYLQGMFITEDDGTNYDPYWVANLQLMPFDATFFQMPLVALATTFIKYKGLFLPPVVAGGANTKLVIFNNSGVSITFGTVSLYPAGDDIG